MFMILLMFHAARQWIRKIRKVNCETGKEQAYPLVPFLLLGMVISFFGFCKIAFLKPY